MARKRKIDSSRPPRCEFSGCKDPVLWAARKLFGKRDTILTCDHHRPDTAKLPPALKDLGARIWYDVQPIQVTATDPDGNTVAYVDGFDPEMDASGRFPVGPGYWSYSHVDCP